MTDAHLSPTPGPPDSPSTRAAVRVTCQRLVGHLGAWGLALVILARASPVQASGRPIRFDRLSVEDGLSQSHVAFILQDSVGFMWFGTGDGLNRFDGVQFHTYKSDPADPAALPDDFVWAAQEDASGDLWLALDAGGVARWERDRDRFVRFRHDPADPSSLASDVVRSLLIDNRSRLWVGTSDAGLDLLDPASGAATHYRHDPGDPASLSHDAVFALFEDRSGAIWVGGDGGLNRLDPQSGSFERYQHDPADRRSLSDDRVRSIYQTSNGELWIGTRDGGLNRWAGRDRGFVRYNSAPESPGSLSHDSVRAILEDDDGRLWIGTAAGLDLLDRERGSFVHYSESAGDPNSLSDANVRSLYQDRGGVVWVGTQFGGVNKWNPTTWSFGHHDAAASGLSGANVQAFAEGGDDMLWVGTLDGLNRLDRRSGRVRHYRHDPSDPRSLSDDRITSLLRDRDGGLWVGTLASGLNYMAPGSNRFTVYRHDGAGEATLSADGIMCLYEDAFGVIWLGTFGGGLNSFDRSSGRFTVYRQNHATGGTLSDDRVTAIAEEPSGALWIGTERGGLNRFDSESGRFEVFRYSAEDPTSLSSDTVYGLHAQPDGTLYVATRHGLNRLARFRGGRAVFERYTERQGLANEVVYGVLADGSSGLWLSTEGGLSRFDLESRDFTNYDASHGLQGNEFNFGAYHRTSAGELLFGGSGGFNAFFPDELKFNSHVPPVVLTAFLKFNKPAPSERPAHRLEAIDLGYLDDVVTFEFAALDYAAPSRNRYSYQLQGFDADWIDLGNIHRVTYTDLAPGDYLFRVRAANNEGVWNEQGLTVAVAVEPPPWRTWWAQVLYGLGLAGIALAVVRVQRRRARSAAEYQRRLESEVQARTQELQERNEQLEVLNQKLSDASLTDSLTGLRNRRFLFEEVSREVALIRREHVRGTGESAERLMFIMIDLDGFKPINDAHGHAAGDRLLISVRQILEQACRTSDVLIRWGGDEFLVVARQADHETAEILPERIRSALQEHRFDLGEGQEGRLTASIGVAMFPMANTDPASVTLDQILALADRALYVAKKSGRNAWVCFMGAAGPDVRTGLAEADVDQLFQDGQLELCTSFPPDNDLIFT